MGCALPSISTTSWPAGVSACSRNIQRCGMKLRVTPLSGLYSKIFINDATSLTGFKLRRVYATVRLLPNWNHGISVLNSPSLWSASGRFAARDAMRGSFVFHLRRRLTRLGKQPRIDFVEGLSRENLNN